jgi:hypothetical protein
MYAKFPGEHLTRQAPLALCPEKGNKNSSPVFTAYGLHAEGFSLLRNELRSKLTGISFYKLKAKNTLCHLNNELVAARLCWVEKSKE